MEYINYIKTKLDVDDECDINMLVDRAVLYLGGPSPKKSSFVDYAIVDNWITEILKKWNVRIRDIHTDEKNLLGKLEPQKQGFILNLNSSLRAAKKRFVLAHEIAHILSYDNVHLIPEYRITHSWEEEDFCDQIARAILLPSSLLKIESINIQDQNENLYETIIHIQNTFKVSIWQILLRIIGGSNNQFIIPILWKFNENENCLKIVSYNKNRGNKVFIPLGDRILLNKGNSSINLSPKIAYKSRKFIQDFDLISIGSLYKKKYFTTCFPFNSFADEFVVQLINIYSQE